MSLRPDRGGPLLLALVVVAAAACAARKGTQGGDGPSLGVYRAHLAREGKADTSFRLLLWAELPDRLHAEVLPPVGGPSVVIDSGGGRLSIARIDQRRAWLGSSSGAAVEKAIGIPVEVASLVSMLLLGRSSAGLAFRREPPTAPGLPETFEIQSGPVAVRLERRGLRRRAGNLSRIGTGTPPDGFECGSLDDLVVEGGALVELEGEDP